jgi:rRNA-processing protein FCF1
VVKDLKELLSQHKDKQATAQWAVTLKASGRYGRHLKITEDNQLCIDHKAIQQAAQYDGKWVIQTNDDTLTVEDAACGYKALLVIEQCFEGAKANSN